MISSVSRFFSRTLDNGLRVVVEVMPDVPSAAAGFFACTGGRDEVPQEAGVSHFLEHMCFKGTPQRHWEQITVDLDALGSTYNAYTTKDRTFYYGWVPADRIEPQIEILADMMRSTIPQEEFDMEKKVVLEEIAMAADSMDSQAYDFMHERIYGDHALSWPVLGYAETVSNMTRDQMASYFERRYAPNNLVLIVAGRVDPDRIFDLAAELTAEWPATREQSQRRAPTFTPGASCKVIEKYNQQVVSAVFPAPGGMHDDSEISEAVASILGGDNSPFYWEIVQEGIAPRAGVWRVDYAECGLMMLYGECDPQQCEALTDAMVHQAKKMAADGISEEAVQRVRNRRRTSLAIESEAPYYRINQILDDIDYRDVPQTVEERLAEVDAVTPQRVAEYLEAYSLIEGGHFISVGPRDWLPE
jgi:predicted Zn-dependent peptidase